ncbi:MAG: hypothetical protein DCC68_11445 [Planctomycetota bacterium]|nr:MAG: hypothetical protein DCC68_11445 [Planctomycetota bacterium]
MSASAIRAGRAFVELFTKDDELRKGLSRAQTMIAGFAKRVDAVGTKLLQLGTFAAAPFAFAIKAASDLEETMNKFNVVFGRSADVVKEWSDTFAGEIGRSKQQIADFLASSADLFKPLGFAVADATEMSKQVTKLAIDLASFNNKADDEPLRDLHAALTGSGEVMKKYGVIVSEAAVKQELLNRAIDPKNATEMEKVMARWNIILAGTKDAQGDAARSAESFANKAKTLQGELSNTAAAIGKELLPVVTPLLAQVTAAVKQFADWAAVNKETVQVVAELTAGAIALAAALKLVAAALSAVAVAQKGFNLTILASRALGPWAAVGAAIAGVATYVAELVDQTNKWNRALDTLRKKNKGWDDFSAHMDRVLAEQAAERERRRAARAAQAADDKARGGIPKDEWERRKAGGPDAFSRNRELERQWGAQRGFTPDDIAGQQATVRDLERRQKQMEQEKERDLEQGLLRAVEEWLAAEKERADILDEQRRETQRLLERNATTLVAGSEEAAKVLLDHFNPQKNPALDVAEKQLAVAERQDQKLGAIERKLDGPEREWQGIPITAL